MSAGIHAFGGYVPRLRLQRRAIVQASAWFNPALMSLGRGERAIAGWDEDAITMEDLHISPEGGAVKDVMDGFFDAGGALPCQIDGGLKCFGHPIGASGLRMIYEVYLQMLARAGERQRAEEPVLGLTHNLGGFPHQNVCSVVIVGREGARAETPSSSSPRSHFRCCRKCSIEFA